MFSVICFEAIIYLLLYNLHDCTFNNNVFTIADHYFMQDSRVTKIEKVTPRIFIGFL